MDLSAVLLDAYKVLFEATYSGKYKKHTMDELVDRYDNDPSVFISFTSVDKIGVNPRSEYKTPNGIYTYNLFDSNDTYGPHEFPFIPEDVEFCTFMEYTGNSMMDSDNYSDDNYKIDRKKLIEKFGKELVMSIVETENKAHNFTPFGRMWYVTRKLANGKPNVWASIFKYLGYDAVRDRGNGVIHMNEEAQTVFFSISNLKILHRIEYYASDAMKKLVHAIKYNPNSFTDDRIIDLNAGILTDVINKYILSGGKYVNNAIRVLKKSQYLRGMYSALPLLLAKNKDAVIKLVINDPMYIQLIKPHDGDPSQLFQRVRKNVAIHFLVLIRRAIELGLTDAHEALEYYINGDDYNMVEYVMGLGVMPTPEQVETASKSANKKYVKKMVEAAEELTPDTVAHLINDMYDEDYILNLLPKVHSISIDLEDAAHDAGYDRVDSELDLIFDKSRNN